METKDFEVLWSEETIEMLLNWSPLMIEKLLGEPDQFGDSEEDEGEPYYSSDKLLGVTKGSHLFRQVEFINRSWIDGKGVLIEEFIQSGSGVPGDKYIENIRGCPVPLHLSQRK